MKVNFRPRLRPTMAELPTGRNQVGLCFSESTLLVHFQPQAGIVIRKHLVFMRVGICRSHERIIAIILHCPNLILLVNAKAAIKRMQTTLLALADPRKRSLSMIYSAPER